MPRTTEPERAERDPSAAGSRHRREGSRPSGKSSGSTTNDQRQQQQPVPALHPGAEDGERVGLVARGHHPGRVVVAGRRQAERAAPPRPSPSRRSCAAACRPAAPPSPAKSPKPVHSSTPFERVEARGTEGPLEHEVGDDSGGVDGDDQPGDDPRCPRGDAAGRGPPCAGCAGRLGHLGGHLVTSLVRPAHDARRSGRSSTARRAGQRHDSRAEGHVGRRHRTAPADELSDRPSSTQAMPVGSVSTAQKTASSSGASSDPSQPIAEAQREGEHQQPARRRGSPSRSCGAARSRR